MLHANLFWLSSLFHTVELESFISSSIVRFLIFTTIAGLFVCIYLPVFSPRSFSFVLSMFNYLAKCSTLQLFSQWHISEFHGFEGHSLVSRFSTRLWWGFVQSSRNWQNAVASQTLLLLHPPPFLLFCIVWWVIVLLLLCCLEELA